MNDVELGDEYKLYDVSDTERHALLPAVVDPEELGSSGQLEPRSRSGCTPSKPRFSIIHLVSAFVCGTIACLLAQYVICGRNCFSSKSRSGGGEKAANVLAPPYVGSTERHRFPPTSPTNAFPSLFPTAVGYAGETPTGAEPALVATAPSYPIHTGAAQLVLPASLGGKADGKKGQFDLFRSWGNLSPWYSVGKGAFGLDSGPEAPQGCRVTGLHLLHRHGARYPTAYGECS
jgi:hypothetical protein